MAIEVREQVCEECRNPLSTRAKALSQALLRTVGLSVMALTCRLETPARADLVEAELLDLEPSLPDPELAAVAEALRRPVVLESALFGTFTLDRRLNRFEGRYRLSSGQHCEVAFERSAGGDAQDLASAEEVLSAFERRLSAFRSSVIEQLLPLYNDAWRAPGSRKASAASLARRLRLTSIHIDPQSRDVELASLVSGPVDQP